MIIFMNKIIIMITVIFLLAGCSHRIQPVSPQNTDKINARVLVYIPENFKYYQSDKPTVIQTISFKFNEPVTTFLPAFFNDTFVKADLTDTKADLNDDYDFLAVPKFDRVTFDSDRTFGHELRVYVSISFTHASQADPIKVEGTGLAKDFYGRQTIYEQDMANQAFADALKELKNNIQNKRSDFENNDH